MASSDDESKSILPIDFLYSGEFSLRLLVTFSKVTSYSAQQYNESRAVASDRRNELQYLRFLGCFV